VGLKDHKGNGVEIDPASNAGPWNSAVSAGSGAGMSYLSSRLNKVFLKAGARQAVIDVGASSKHFLKQ
jgi:hypothetical protein